MSSSKSELNRIKGERDLYQISLTNAQTALSTTQTNLKTAEQNLAQLRVDLRNKTDEATRLDNELLSKKILLRDLQNRAAVAASIKDISGNTYRNSPLLLKLDTNSNVRPYIDTGHGNIKLTGTENNFVYVPRSSWGASLGDVTFSYTFSGNNYTVENE